MLSFTSSLATLVAVIGLFSQASATTGIINNNNFAATVNKQSVALSPGNYRVRNYVTGQYLQFYRSGVTHLATKKTKGSLKVTQGSKYGQSGRKKATWSGSILSGQSKCMSAQFTKGENTAAVSYACKVGANSGGTKSLEVAKQFWRLVPCDSGSINFTPSKKTTNLSKKSAPKKKTSSKKKAVKKCQHPGWWLARHPTYVTKQGHSECKSRLAAYKKQGKRDLDSLTAPTTSHHDLAKLIRKQVESDEVEENEIFEHADVPDEIVEEEEENSDTETDYEEDLIEPGVGGEVDEEEIEQDDEEIGEEFTETPYPQEDEVDGTVSLAKRSSLEKRVSSGTYCIIAVDHLTDMVGRAVGSKIVTTVGGYKSMQLLNYNKKDKNQWWVFTKA